MEPNLIPLSNINLKNSELQIMIYDNFVILEKDIVELFINNINGNEDNYLECILREGKIIINYPDNININKNFISVIGTIIEENIFLKEYILIYVNYTSFYNHTNKIKMNLINYLDNLKLINNSEPIINSYYEEIGIIIKFEDNINNIKKKNENNIDNNYNYKMDIEKKYDNLKEKKK